MPQLLGSGRNVAAAGYRGLNRGLWRLPKLAHKPTSGKAALAKRSRDGKAIPRSNQRRRDEVCAGLGALHSADRSGGHAECAVHRSRRRWVFGHGGLAIGKDSAEPVTGDYPGEAPWSFTGGTILRAAVDVSGEPFVDLAAEARIAFLRD